MPALSGTRTAQPLGRLHVGCGSRPAPGWINADRRPGEGVDLCVDLREGLPMADDSVDCAVAMHVLQDLAWNELPGVLAELRRVLRPGGTLRLGLPDLDRAIDAYRRGDAAYFHVPDRDAASIGAKLVTQLVWYGSVRTPFCFDFARELLEGAGFRAVQRSRFGHSDSGHPEIASLDNRERETLFVEAQA
jgi:predicted SAM-dependent methyltransferase